MQVKVLRQFLNGRRIVHEGERIEVDERRAIALERHRPPLIVREIGSGSVPAMTRQSLVGEGANAGSQDPTNTPRAGGRTGEGKPASSSRRGQARSKRASSGRGGKRGSSR